MFFVIFIFVFWFVEKLFEALVPELIYKFKTYTLYLRSKQSS